MNSIRPISPVLAVISAIGIAACGGGSSRSSASTAKASASGAMTHTIDAASTSLGDILVDARGRTLYLFQSDTATKSTCGGACAAAWPPLRAGDRTTGAGLKSSLVGTIKRSDGSLQVTYDGHPLYLFSGDHNPGDTNGEGSTAFGAKWFVISPQGRAVSTGSVGVGY